MWYDCAFYTKMLWLCARYLFLVLILTSLNNDQSFMGWTHWAISHSSQCSTTGVTKSCGMCYPICGMMHIKEPLPLIGKSSPCGGSGFPFSLSEWSFTICLTPYNRKWNVWSASLNKTFPSFLWITSWRNGKQ